MGTKISFSVEKDKVEDYFAVSSQVQEGFWLLSDQLINHYLILKRLKK